MERHLIWFAASCTCVCYALWYTVHVLISATEDDEAGNIRYWYKTLTLQHDNTESVGSAVRLILCVALVLATVSIGLWIFCCQTNKSLGRPKKRIRSTQHVTVIVGLIAVLAVGLILPTTFSLVLIAAVTFGLVVVSQQKVSSGSTAFYQLFWRMFSWLFIISIPWEFMRLYQHQVALKYTNSINGPPSDCVPSEPTWWATLGIWITETLTWGGKTSACHDYHRAMLVEPLWEITPVMVITSLLSRCVTHPFEVLAHSTGKSFQQLFQHIPAQWQIVILFVLVILTIILTLVWNGYAVKIPFILHIGPTTGVDGPTKRREALEPTKIFKIKLK